MAKTNKLKAQIKKLRVSIIGQRIFLVAIVLALILGAVIPYNQTVAVVMIILGLFIGAINITAKEDTLFLLASITLIFATNSLFLLPWVGDLLQKVFGYLVYLVAPAATLVAFGVFYKLASTR